MLNRRIVLIFTVVLLLPSMYLFKLGFQGETTVNETENRTMTTMESFNKTSFFSGSFQDVFEDYLADQFIESENIKRAYQSVVSTGESIFRNQVLRNNCALGRYEMKEGVYNLGCDRLLGWEEYNEYLFNDKIQLFFDLIDTHLSGLDQIHLYFINESRAFSDSLQAANPAHYANLSREADERKIETAQLEVNSLSDYTHYFYQTDHHWNLYGSYRGYQDLVELLFEDEVPISPLEKHTFDKPFYGSFSRLIGYYSYHDTFSIYDFNYPVLTVKIDGVQGIYGYEKEYMYNGWVLSDNSNFYGGVYGGNYGELVFTSEHEEKDNILIFATSYMNPINKLIASHFYNTHVIDLRYVSEQFDFRKYIEENEIDQVLFVGDIDFYVNFTKWWSGE